MKIIIKFRIFLWLVLVGVVCWLLYMKIAPSGQISYVYDFKKDNYFISKLTPDIRVKQPKDNKQEIVGDPVYFTLRAPRRFDKAKLILKYKNNSGLPIIETGVLADKIIWRYNLQPIENRIINKLATVWNVTQNNDVMLLQREKKYNNINEFLNNLPEINQIALYNYDLKNEFLLTDYASSSENNILDYSLRGAWQFWTYIKNENLDFSFIFQDLNKNKDNDPIDLHLYYNNQLINSRHLDDDGISDDNNKISAENELKLKLANLPEGAYKIELRVNDDIITKNIMTKQNRLAFINKLWLVGENNNINLYTDSNAINAQTANPNSLQAVQLDNKELDIDQTYKQFNATTISSTTKLLIEKSDIIISGDGMFSFKKDSLINPNFKKVNANLDIDKQNINYILAKYNIPKEQDGWKIASAEFDLSRAYNEDNKYSFLISIPELRADDDVDDWIEVDEIRMELEGETLWDKIKNKIKNAKSFVEF